MFRVHLCDSSIKKSHIICSKLTPVDQDRFKIDISVWIYKDFLKKLHITLKKTPQKKNSS